MTGQANVGQEFTQVEKDKLGGIPAGAEVNVQSDWNQTNTGDDSFIRNKPTIPTGSGASTFVALTDTPPALGANGTVLGVEMPEF